MGIIKQQRCHLCIQTLLGIAFYLWHHRQYGWEYAALPSRYLICAKDICSMYVLMSVFANHEFDQRRDYYYYSLLKKQINYSFNILKKLVLTTKAFD